MSQRSLFSLANLAKYSVPKGAQRALCVLATEKQQGREKVTGKGRWALLAGASLSLAGMKLSEEDKKEEKVFAEATPARNENTTIHKETKMRRNQPLDKIFDYFSSYQMIDNKGSHIQENQILLFRGGNLFKEGKQI